MDSLQIVPLDEILQLRDRFRVEWPKYVTAWNCLDSQYRNLKNIKDFPVEVCTAYGDFNNGIVVIWQLIPNCQEISLYCLHDDHTKLIEAIRTTTKIKWTQKTLFACIREELNSSAIGLLKEKYNNTDVLADYTYITHIDRDIAKNFQYEIPNDVKIEQAKVEHAKEIDSIWPHRYPGSEDYFRKMIGFGLTTVLVGAEQGELRGWVLTSIRGDEHALQVKNEYKRRGYGQILTKYLGKKLAKDEREVFGCVVITNVVSQKMFKKMDFNQLHQTSWIFNAN